MTVLSFSLPTIKLRRAIRDADQPCSTYIEKQRKIQSSIREYLLSRIVEQKLPYLTFLTLACNLSTSKEIIIYFILPF